ncbi:MAG: hypothetical protein PHX78_04280, partial [bacterium]|nr:hypothetical protein [bacterium]
MYIYIKRLFILAFIILMPLEIGAFDFNSESKTYFSVRENGENQRNMPLYEYLDLDVNDIAKKDISFHFGGWMRQDLADKSFNDQKFDSDLQYGYFSLLDKNRNTKFDFGRLNIFEGVSYERVDGVYASSNLEHNISISAYGGRTVKTNFDETGNYIFGSRISQGKNGSYNLGVSYLMEKDYSVKIRDEACADAWFVPLKKMELSGRSVINLEKSVWQEHSYYMTLGPFNKLKMILDSQWINYEYYFSSMTSNAFKLQPDIIDPAEKVLILGGQAEYPVSKKLMVSADYKNYNYKISGRADYYGGEG